MTMIELLPCPFCGVLPQTKEWIVGNREQIKIICDGDFCHVHPSIFGNKETMTDVWNTRAKDSDLIRGIELAEMALKMSWSNKYINGVEAEKLSQHALAEIKKLKGEQK